MASADDQLSCTRLCFDKRTQVPFVIEDPSLLSMKIPISRNNDEGCTFEGSIQTGIFAQVEDQGVPGNRRSCNLRASCDHRFKITRN